MKKQDIKPIHKPNQPRDITVKMATYRNWLPPYACEWSLQEARFNSRTINSSIFLRNLEIIKLFVPFKYSITKNSPVNSALILDFFAPALVFVRYSVSDYSSLLSISSPASISSSITAVSSLSELDRS